MSSSHILIIGGGIGGLTVAQGLRKKGIPFTLFERDASPAARAQGYRLRIAGGGAEAIQECIDEKLWALFENTCAESKPMGSRFSALDLQPLEDPFPGAHPGVRPGQGPPEMKAGSSIGGMQAPEGGFKSYAVDRTILRSLLLLDQEENIQFGKTFTHYEITPGGVTAFFDDGTSKQGTFLIGADGMFSPVRKQLLPNLRYVDTGSRVIFGKTPLNPEILARLAPGALSGMSVIREPNVLALFLETIQFPNDAAVESAGKLSRTEDYIYWALCGNATALGGSDSEFQSLSAEAATELTLKVSEHWHPSVRCLFELQDVAQTAPLRLASAKPERPEWNPSARVTLIGDAIHGMMPLGGSGANCALVDAALLVRLISEKGICEEMARSYIDEMWSYALPLIQRSGAGAQKILGFKGFENATEI
ncbi:uncharacterized protein BP5553_05632 [Venustampulla echinocandica]|uniref:FAD-binding domain-containing protein n=1 Tax=Venustampulla echinocandica TaxID=2656787 RepID=A0A370TRP2_9HELO|nr:uncharacterized protein BP5553_05632 [Venustampulla echinocandica]RDL38199.1 hypothetical protein BP5553_05632 [Venustampulla echinocandica]